MLGEDVATKRSLAGQLSGPPLKVELHAIVESGFPVFGRTIVRPSIEGAGLPGRIPFVGDGLAGQLSGPPLKAAWDVGLQYLAVQFGRTIVRPSIEGRSRPGRRPSTRRFGRTIVRPSIEGRFVYPYPTLRGGVWPDNCPALH